MRYKTTAREIHQVQKEVKRKQNHTAGQKTIVGPKVDPLQGLTAEMKVKITVHEEKAIGAVCRVIVMMTKRIPAVTILDTKQGERETLLRVSLLGKGTLEGAAVARARRATEVLPVKGTGSQIVTMVTMVVIIVAVMKEGPRYQHKNLWNKVTAVDLSDLRKKHVHG